MGNILKQRAKEPPTDYTDLHGYWVRGEGHESHGCSTRNICDNPWNLWENILSSSMRRSLPQITQIYTDIGYGEEGHESHGRSIRKICDNPWNLWENILKKKSVTIREICGKTFSQAKSVRICEICGKTFSQAKSVRICEICGKTSLKLRAEEPPTDYADLHGYWVQGEGHESHGYGCV